MNWRLSRLDPDWNWSNAAIIARDWRRLAPVRAYAEAGAIPVEIANESLGKSLSKTLANRIVSGGQLGGYTRVKTTHFGQRCWR